MPDQVQRKLTTILAADVEGYSRAMGSDEVQTVEQLRSTREVFFRFIERHNGRVANTAGDGLIAEFPSVVEAVQCAIEVQHELADASLRYRIGIHLGDVIMDEQDLLGDGVNLAARLEAMAEPGGVLISQQVYDQVHAKLTVAFEYLGEKRPKNLAEDVGVYRVTTSSSPRLSVFPSPKPPKRPRPAVKAPAPPDLRARVIRRGKLAGVLLAGLLAVDLASGAPFWMHWPALAILTLLALEAMPLLVQGAARLPLARFAVVVLALTLINLFSWTGVFWAIWPAIALAVVLAVTRILTRG